MWSLSEVNCSFKLWFSDGAPVGAVRSRTGVSYRLIVDTLGFLDLTEMPYLTQPRSIIANDKVLMVQPNPRERAKPNHNLLLNLHLRIDNGGGFVLAAKYPADITPNIFPDKAVSGKLEPLPSVCAADADFIDTMIEQKYVPYPKIPDAPGKSIEEIETLGRRLFPFTPFSFQLAMCVYDWTTASFTRMVFMKIFEYIGIPPPPFPIDKGSIAAQIWASNWGPYKPQDPDYMYSFMMKPADSLDDVKEQLGRVAADLHKFSEVENRLLSAAMQALPRTSIFQHRQLFSGQMDIYQLGLSHFGIEFLECPLNKGPVDEELTTTFADVLADYVSVGKTITTKMVWSFTDNAKDAMHYSNGILLVANMPGNSWVWEQAAYVTPLSDDPKKTEYTFPPGTQFEVQSVSEATVDDKKVVVIVLQGPSSGARHKYEKALPGVLDGEKIQELIESGTPVTGLPHTPGVTGGRRCAC